MTPGGENAKKKNLIVYELDSSFSRFPKSKQKFLNYEFLPEASQTLTLRISVRKLQSCIISSLKPK